MERILLLVLSVLSLFPLALPISIQLSHHLSEHRLKAPQELNKNTAGGAVISDSLKSSLGTSSSIPEGWKCEDFDACSDRQGYEAILALHTQLDDDANGSIDIAESDDFLRDELNYENGYERQNAFHRNDKFISVDELWMAWKASAVRNWTTEETIEWLVTSVDLPQYSTLFQNKHIDGTHLPRMAVNSQNYLSSVLGIKDLIHKQKLALKAMDVVLFGPPRHRNYFKDVILLMLLIVAIGGCWFAAVQHRYSQTHIKKMMKDMESLQNAEDALKDLQKELDKAKQEQEIVVIQKQNLERRLQDEMLATKQESSPEFLDLDANKRVNELETQLHHAKNQLDQAEKSLQSRSWAPPPDLQRWLQLTHELELKHYNIKKQAAEKQLEAAKEGCEKLRRKRSSIMEAFRIAHGGNIDDIDHQILQAKSSLCEVTKDLQERLHRWKKIETLCGFPIVLNPGLAYLETSLASKAAATGTQRLSPPPSYSTTKHNSEPALNQQDDGILTEEEVEEELDDEEDTPDSASNLHSPNGYETIREGMGLTMNVKPPVPIRKLAALKSVSSQEFTTMQLEHIRPKLTHADSLQDVSLRKSTKLNSKNTATGFQRGLSSPMLDEEGNSTDSTVEGESLKQNKKKSFLNHFKKSSSKKSKDM